MAKIIILSVGNIKENWIKEGISEYTKRLPKNLFCEIQVKDSNKEKESLEIKKQIEKLDNTYFIVLDESGQHHTSRELAELIKAKQDSNICFIIGGPDGVEKSVLKYTHKTISLSKFTFTHEMAKLILTEQIYRSHTILQGKPYHRQ